MEKFEGMRTSGRTHDRKYNPAGKKYRTVGVGLEGLIEG
jgi:hypothetical protein